MNNVWAQTSVNYKDLAADFYDADGDVAVVLLHGTLAHNRMEIINTIRDAYRRRLRLPGP